MIDQNCSVWVAAVLRDGRAVVRPYCPVATMALGLAGQFSGSVKFAMVIENAAKADAMFTALMYRGGSVDGGEAETGSKEDCQGEAQGTSEAAERATVTQFPSGPHRS